jgi:uncharacterized membrane protein YfcA
MNTVRLVAWLVLPIVALVVLGVFAVHLISALFGVAIYLIIGAAVAASAVYLYRKGKRAVAPGTRNRNRIEAAAETYRMRNR